VNAASPGNKIHVAPGIYNEDVTVPIPLSIIGAGAPKTTVDGDGTGNNTFTINSVNVRLSGFTITGGNGNSQAGIALSGAGNSIISNDRIIGNSYGINILQSSGASIQGNTISNNCFSADGSNVGYFSGGAGINVTPTSVAEVSNNLKISGNTINANCRLGIFLAGVFGTASTGDHITGNKVFNNYTQTGGESGIDLLRVSYSWVQGNLVHDSGWVGIYCHNSCNNNTFNKNVSYFNGRDAKVIAVFGGGGEFGDGIQIRGTTTEGAANNIVENNNLHNNLRDGLLIRQNATGNTVHNNLVSGNARNGIKLGIEAQCANPTTCGDNFNSFPSDAPSPVPTTNSVRDNTILGNGAVGIYTADASNPANYNNITGNGTGVENTGSTAVDATHNWWGCPTGPGTSGCDTVSGLVNYVPFLTHRHK